MAPHSSSLAWKIPRTEEPGGLQSMGSLRVRHDWATSLSLFTCTGEGNGNPLQCSYLENPRDGAAWWAAIYGVAQSRTRLQRLSSNSSREVRQPFCSGNVCLKASVECGSAGPPLLPGASDGMVHLRKCCPMFKNIFIHCIKVTEGSYFNLVLGWKKNWVCWTLIVAKPV